MRRHARVRLLSAMLALLAIALSGGTAPGSASAAGVAGAERASRHTPATASATWATYHFNAQRSGYDPSQPTFTSVKLGWSAPATVDGAVYAEPLIVGNTGVVATENNSVYALDIATGTVVWRTNLGPPAPASSLPCGDIDPVGITSTPVIDQAAGRIYVVGLVKPRNHKMHYVLAALSLANGAILFQENIVVTGLTPRYHIQRGALTLYNGYVYIPFGGRYGDCTPYHGWLIGASAAGGGSFLVFKTSQHNGGGLWQSAGASLDSQGNLYVTSGNTFCPSPCTTNDGGENVFRLVPSATAITETDYFVPSNYAALDNGDLDLGSTGPLLVNGGLIFQVGKAGDGYLLHASSLGHVGGQAFEAHVCPNLTDDASFGGDAYADPYIYVPCNNRVVALTLNSSAPSFAFAWQGPATQGADPPIVAGGYVWIYDHTGGTIYALNPTTGAVFYSANIGAGEHFATPAAGDGSVIVATTTQIFAFVNGG